MTKNIVILLILFGFTFNSCKESSQQENKETTATETVDKPNDDIVKSTSTDKDGKKLELTFNNTKGTTTLNFNGETIELVAENAASGIWYKNDHYELRGKGNDIELMKDGKVVFTHKDEIVNSTLKNKEGQTLDMIFNNTTQEAKIYLNGGEEIVLTQQRAGSGIWYKNDHYELRGKGDNMELTKDGKTIFKNEKK